MRKQPVSRHDLSTGLTLRERSSGPTSQNAVANSDKYKFSRVLLLRSIRRRIPACLVLTFRMIAIVAVSTQINARSPLVTEAS